MMRQKPITSTTKVGQQIQIRSLEENEAQALIDLKLSYIKNTTTIPIYLNEFENDETKEADLIKRFNENKRCILLAATANGELIGNLDLIASKRKKMNHTAMLGMGIHENWRNMGVGACLIQAATSWAKEWTDLEIIWLEVYASNQLGLGLYEKMGFTISGTIEGFFKEGNNYYDKIQMYKRI